MYAIVGCEFSAVVRDALNARGVDAWSCDLLPTEGRQANHLHGDLQLALKGDLYRFDAVDMRTGHKPLMRKWDMGIFHPECTFLCNSGVKWLYKGGQKRNGTDPTRWDKMAAGAQFFLRCWNSDIEKVCVENPIMHGYALNIIGVGPTQIIQPWMFGTPETKATCLWLRGLRPLKPKYPTWEACRVALGLPVGAKPKARVHLASPGTDRWKERSRTDPNVAAAMAEQWC